VAKREDVEAEGRDRPKVNDDNEGGDREWETDVER